MKIIHFLSLGLTSTALLVACGDDSGTGTGTGGGSTTATTTNTGGGTTTTTTTTTTTGSGGSGGGTPAVPTLGTQVDRMGRPAINTALNQTFALVAGGASTTAAREAAQDSYNQNGTEAGWTTAYGPTFEIQLAVLDSVDTSSTVTNAVACANQLASCANITTATDCYVTLAGALTADRLWIDSAGTGCTAGAPTAGGYLALEANALAGTTFTDCGGRRPIDDVILRTYSVLVLGTLTGIDDGQAAPTNLHPATFPYLAAPQ